MSPQITRPSRPASAALALLCAVALLAGSATAQVWVPLESPSAPGTPAEVNFLPAESSPGLTTIEIKLHGFWKQAVLGADGKTYQRLTFPGLGAIGQLGAPELPAARFALATSEKAATVTLGPVQVLKQQDFPSLLVYPTPDPAMDEEPTEDPGPGDTQGSEEKFALDAALYALSQPWPATLAAPSVAVRKLVGPVTGAAVAVHPVTWNPASGLLEVKTWLKVRYNHSSGGPPAGLTLPKAQQASAAFLNWTGVSSAFAPNPVDYHARLLVVAESSHWSELAAFVSLKRAMGYHTELRLPGADLDGTRAVIADWHADGAPEMDHFCMLVGDTDSIPLGWVTKNDKTVGTDDLYGSVGHDELAKDVHVGRLSVDSDEDLEQQLKKIMQYETDPLPGGHYERALLVAHLEGAPGKYFASHEAVRTASYSNPPTFLKRYGVFEISDGPVLSDIEAGVGLVAYRGHGSTNAWTGWNLLGSDFNKADVLSLSNELQPVVWSFACTNADIDPAFSTSDDCQAETWMEAEGAGGVAAYAATRTTTTTVNTLHDLLAFQVLYGDGVTTHGEALDLSEMLLDVSYPGHHNPWAYLLLGDPTMTVRTKAPKSLVMALPVSAPIGALTGELKLEVEFDNGLPADGALVSAHKPAFLNGAPDEVLAAKWLGSNGKASLALTALTPGKLNLVARTADGSVLLHTIEVTMDPAWTDLGAALAPVGGAAPELVGLGSLAGGQPMSLLMHDAAPGQPAWLLMGLAEDPLPFKGGTIIPSVQPPSLVLPLATDAAGNLTLSAAWPVGVPAGVKIYAQVWVKDAAGPQGFTASNALKGVTP